MSGRLCGPRGCHRALAASAAGNARGRTAGPDGGMVGTVGLKASQCRAPPHMRTGGPVLVVVLLVVALAVLGLAGLVTWIRRARSCARSIDAPAGEANR